MPPEMTLSELQLIYDQFAISAYSDMNQSLYDSWTATRQAMEDHLRYKAKVSIAYFEYDEDTYTLQTEAARLPEWFNPERLYKGDFIEIYNPETGREVEFEFACKHIGPVHSRLVFRSVRPLRRTDDGGSEFLRVIITY